MEENLLDENMRVYEKWLKEPFSSTICRYLETWDYTLDNLQEFNDDYDEIKRTTDIEAIFSSLKITELLYGIVIEDLTPKYYELYYYSFNGENDCAIIEN